MTDLVETSYYDEASDTLIVKTSYDSSAVIADNIMAKNLSPKTGRYKGNLVHVGKIFPGDITRLKNEGYNLLSPDPEEVRRTLLHVQSNEPHMLRVPGTPIAKKKTQWV